MKDSQTVEALSRAGDNGKQSRPIDHWIYFGTKHDQTACAEAAKHLGFEIVDRHDTAEGDRPHSLHLTREDPASLEAIHEVVMELVTLAGKHNGEYDGWESPVIKSEQ